MKVAYFVHDLGDAAVARRIRMLRHAGTDVVVLGFRRAPCAPTSIEGAPAIDLGRTYDGRLLQRSLSVAVQMASVAKLATALRGADALLARNLEVLAIAAAARRLYVPKARLVYECLDLHRTLIEPGWRGASLRGLERALLSECELLILSSPAYDRAHFRAQRRRNGGPPTRLLENKVFEPCRGQLATARSPGPPWRIGWFGMLRCRRSFELLTGLARSLPGAVEVVIGGKASERELPNFADAVRQARGVTFAGPYEASDLARMYRQVHFVWAIDYFEAGANSEWLLPNRLYEGGHYDAVPIALRQTESGLWLAARDIGVRLDDPERELEPFFESLDAAAYGEMEGRIRSAPRHWFAAGEADCRALAQAITGVA